MTTIKRPLDNLNRIVIPKSIRESLGITDHIGISTENNKIILAKGIGKEIEVDKLGRVRIPKSIRAKLELNIRDELEISAAIIIIKE